MESFPTRRSPISVRPDVAGAPPALIIYRVGPEVAAECERIASELRIARAEVKHLQAACVALKTHTRAILVASSAIRSWDRVVVEEHAARGSVPIRWVASDDEANDVAEVVRSWATEALRHTRPFGSPGSSPPPSSRRASR